MLAIHTRHSLVQDSLHRRYDMDAPKLKRVIRLDSIPLDSTYFTEEGYLVDHPILTSVGIFEYTNPDGTKRRELRLPENVFDEKSLATYQGKPIIVTHNAGEVTKDNASQEMIGAILSNGYRDGDDVRAKIIIYDTDRMNRSGLRELSLGYSLDLIEEPGVYNGQPYDAIQTNISVNHLALVGTARAGDQARLNIDGKDNEPLKGGKAKMSEKQDRKDGAMSPEDFDASIKAYQQRRAQRMTAATAEPAPAATEQPAPEVPAKTEDSVGEPQEPEKKQDEAPEAPAPEKPEAEPGQAEEGKKPDIASTIKANRDRRDADGDPMNLESAMAMIAQMDEDIQTLLDAYDQLSASADMQADGRGDKNTDGCGEKQNADSESPKEEPAKEGEKTMNADSIDRIVSQKLELGKIGEKMNIDGLERIDIRQAKCKVISGVNPNIRLDGKSDAYIDAAYDIAKAQVMAPKNTDYQRRQMSQGQHLDSVDETATSSAEAARQRMIARREHREEGGNK